MNEVQPPEEGTSPEVEVLQMLASGKISVDEAERLLNQLSAATQEEEFSSDAHQVIPADPRQLKYLRVLVHDDEDNVDIRIPLKLMMLGVKLDGVMGEVPNEAISSAGIDLGSLSSLDESDFYDAIAGLSIDVNDGDSTVRVYCE